MCSDRLYSGEMELTGGIDHSSKSSGESRPIAHMNTVCMYDQYSLDVSGTASGMVGKWCDWLASDVSMSVGIESSLPLRARLVDDSGRVIAHGALAAQGQELSLDFRPTDVLAEAASNVVNSY